LVERFGVRAQGPLEVRGNITSNGTVAAQTGEPRDGSRLAQKEDLGPRVRRNALHFSFLFFGFFVLTLFDFWGLRLPFSFLFSFLGPVLLLFFYFFFIFFYI
jgi:hypothetical protein